jgi:hypothetical protein
MADLITTSEVAGVRGLANADAARTWLRRNPDITCAGRDMVSGEKLWPRQAVLAKPRRNRGRPKSTGGNVKTEKIYVVHPGQRGSHPKCSRIDLFGDKDLWLMDVDGRRVGDVRKGANRRWFVVPNGRGALANPLDNVDNLSRTGYATRSAAAIAHTGCRVLDETITPYVSDCKDATDNRIED